MEIKKFKGESAFLVSVNPTQVVDYVCMSCYKRLNKIIRTITKESRPYHEDIWYEYGERDYNYSKLYLNDTNGFIYGFDKDEEDGKLVDKALHSYEPHQCPYCGKWAYAIDIKIIPHIIELNKKGWETEFSCSGHKHNGLFERKFEYDDGRVVRRNKIYWTSPYVKFSSDINDFVYYYMNMNEKKIRYNYLPFCDYSNALIYPEGSNAINSEKDYNELIESFLEFCESLPNIREVKKEFEEEISKELEASSFEKEKNQKPMRKDDFNSIDIPSPEEIAKAMANEFETEGSVSGEVVNRWKESIDKGKLGLKRKSQEYIDEMIKMQELEDEKIRRINEAQINIWDSYLDENGKLCISKSQFIRDFKEVHKDNPIFDLPIYSKELDVAWRCFLNDISDITKDKKAVLEEYFTSEKEKEQKEDENFIDDLFDSIDEDYGDEDEL